MKKFTMHWGCNILGRFRILIRCDILSRYYTILGPPVFYLFGHQVIFSVLRFLFIRSSRFGLMNQFVWMFEVLGKICPTDSSHLQKIICLLLCQPFWQPGWLPFQKPALSYLAIRATFLTPWQSIFCFGDFKIWLLFGLLFRK